MGTEIAWSGVITPQPEVVFELPGWSFAGMWGASASDVWAIATDASAADSRIYHWNGGVWTLEFTVTGVDLGQSPGNIWGSASNDVWAVGVDDARANGFVYHWDGFAWTQVHTSSSILFVGVSGTGPNDVWVGGNNLAFTNGYVLHWDGGAWTTSFSSSAMFVESVSATSPSYAIATGTDISGVNGAWTTWNGSSWSAVGSLSETTLDCVTAFSPTLAFACSEESFPTQNRGVYQWSGSAWTQVAAAGIAMDQVFGKPNGAWAVGGTGSSQGVVYRYGGGRWAQFADISSGTMFCGWSIGADTWIGGENSAETVGLIWKMQGGK